jgi:hypothetical protein
LKKKPDILQIDYTIPVISKNRTKDTLPSTKKILEEFPVSLAPSDKMILLEVFDQKFLVKHPLKRKVAI